MFPQIRADVIATHQNDWGHNFSYQQNTNPIYESTTV